MHPEENEERPSPSAHEALRERWKDCTKCLLQEKRINVVLGTGNLSARLMIIGEAPGENEDKEGKPFVGRSGGILDSILGWADIKRDDIYITNVVSCRPKDNRTPNPDEISACRPRLLEEIYLVDPDVLILSGAVASRALTKSRSFKIKRLQGLPVEVTLEGKFVDYTLMAVPTLHPANLLRSLGLEPYGPVHKTGMYIKEAMRAALMLEDIRKRALQEDSNG